MVQNTLFTSSRPCDILCRKMSYDCTRDTLSDTQKGKLLYPIYDLIEVTGVTTLCHESGQPELDMRARLSVLKC